MSRINEMIAKLNPNDYTTKNEQKINMLVEIVSKMECRLENTEKELAEAQQQIRLLENRITLESLWDEKRIEDLESSLEMKGRIIDTLCEQCRNFESFQARTEPCINTLLQGLGELEQKNKKEVDNHFIVSSNIDTLFRANVDRNKEYQKVKEQMEKYNRELAECNKDIIGSHMTLMKYKQENTMLDNRITDLYAENQSRDNGIDTLRLKLIDVLDEVEKNTGEAAEIKRMAMDIYGKNREFERNFGAVMQRMNELESAMKTVTVHWADIREIKEKIKTLEQN